MTRAKGIVGAGVGMVVVARLFAAAPLYVPGVAFLLIGAVAPVWTWFAARGASIRRELNIRRVTEGEPFEYDLRVRCGRTPALGGAVIDPIVPEPILLGPRMRSGTRRVKASFARRGLRHFEPPALLIRDPFDVSRRLCPGRGAAQELLVLPRTEAIRVPTTRGAAPAASFHVAARTSVANLAEVEIDGLAPYREGTSASRIHWPALARGAGLLERRLRAEGEASPLVVLDASGAARPEDLDAAVRAAASITLELARHGTCALLLPGERRATTIDGGSGAWAAAHARLALVEGAAGTTAPVLAGVGMRQGPMFYVAARRLQRLPSAADAIARAGRVLVVPGVLPGRAATFEVAGCSGYSLRVHQGTRKVAVG